MSLRGAVRQFVVENFHRAFRPASVAGHGPAKGFTLIEIMVVIAIIGILSTIVLQSLNSSRTKGKDTRIISNVRQVRVLIEGSSSLTGAYTAGSGQCVAATDTLSSSGNCDTLVDDTAATGGVLTVKATVSGGYFGAYAVYGRLASDSSKYFCMDSTGKVNGAASAATTVSCP